MHNKERESQPFHLDGIENYEIGELLEKSSSRVHLGVCRRGRIKGRQVAIKMTSKNAINLDEKKYREILDIEKRLHHPAIVSLLSSFESQDTFYEVIELCPRGSLAQFIPRSYSEQSGRANTNSTILQEPHLRGVLKTVIDAITYTHRQGYASFDLRPENILLTSDLCIKLSGFSTLTACKSDYGSLRNDFPRHRTTADLWNVGVLGFSLFASQSIVKIHSDWRLDLPSGISYELRDLLDGLLQPDATDRLPLHRVQSHPFFNPDLPIHPLSDLSSQCPSLKSSYLSNNHSSAISPKIKTYSEASERTTLASGVRRSAPNISKNSSHDTKEKLVPRISPQSKLAPLEVKDYDQVQRFSKYLSPSIFQHTPRLCAGILPPQALQTPHGIILIQSEGHVIVDLREGERARGRKGEKVLAVSSGGEKVEVYHEPLVGVPCLLRGATLITTPQDLPPDCKSIYAFAAKYLDTFKRKSPLLVYNQFGARCSIMSNFPNPDIEVCVPNNLSYGKGVPFVPSSPAVRLRMSRQERTIEIATFKANRCVKQANSSYYHGMVTCSSGRVGGEWSKRILPLLSDGRVDTTQLSPEEISAVVRLENFLELSQRLEVIVSGTGNYLESTSERCASQVIDIDTPLAPNICGGESIQDPPIVEIKPISKAKPRLAGMGLPPRPRRLSVIHRP